MNDYIFDWAENSEKILAGGGYTTKVHQTFEQIMLFAYLRERGYSKDEIFSLWIETDSLLLKKIGDDENQRDKYFGKLFADSTKYKIEKGNRIDIYQSEIDFINSLVVLPWIKEYLLAILCVYKYMGYESCEYNKKIRNFCFSCTSINKEQEYCCLKIKEALDKYKFYSVYNYNNKAFFKINFCDNSNGKKICSISNPRNVLTIMKFLSNNKRCEKCGNIFEYNSKSIKNKLCPNCHRKNRIKKQVFCHKNQHSKILF